MLLLGVIAAVILVIVTRKSEIITHDPAEGLPRSGGSSPFQGVLDVVKDVAKQMEEQAREQQRRQQGRAEPHVPGPLGKLNRVLSADLEDIRGLIRTGQTVDAIKLYRMKYRVGMKEAREAVEKLADGG